MTPYYSDDACTIYHGDCDYVVPTLDAVDLIVTSPPYNLGVSTGGGFADIRRYPEAKTGTWSGGALAQGYADHSDDMDPVEYRGWQQRIIDLCAGVLGPDGAMFYVHKPRVQAGVLWTPLSFRPGPGLELRQVIVWDRGSGMNFAPTHFVPSCEWIVVWARQSFRLRPGATGLGDVWRIAPETRVDHPAPFPLGIPARAIAATGPSVVLDPFMGSGTTLRAAKDAGVRAIGIELSERYCEIAAKRLAQEVLDLGGAA